MNIDADFHASFKDIFYSHGENIFSIDQETIERSMAEKVFFLRVFWKDGGWREKLMPLEEFSWPTRGLPFAVAKAPEWKDVFASKWIAATNKDGTEWSQRRLLLAELSGKVDLAGRDSATLDMAEFPAWLNCLFSLSLGRPIGSRQTNIAELINTFLYSERRHHLAGLLVKAIHASGQSILLERDAIKKKVATALNVYQYDELSHEGKVAVALFPQWYGA